jgi:hypothetical protein
MSKTKKLVIANVSALIGIAISIFLVPPNTPLWIWASGSAGALLLL